MGLLTPISAVPHNNHCERGIPGTVLSRMRSFYLVDLTDEGLLQQLQCGVADALAVLFDRHYRLVFSMAHRILRDSGEAEDLMQEVFLEVYRDAGKFDPARGSVKTWILQRAKHQSLNRWKYLKLRGHYDERSVYEPAEPCNAPSLADWQSSIRRSLDQLSENERRVIEQVCFEGLVLKEVADRTREPLPNIRNYYYRGLKKLRVVLGLGTANARR
jgi:RNA polymerase sigma-70 factor, ECF subfamily